MYGGGHTIAAFIMETVVGTNGSSSRALEIADRAATGEH
jgi:hypothetical protein